MTTTAPPTTRLKLTEVFRAVYRRGRWSHSPALSVGILPNCLGKTRVGLRTGRGVKGSVQRNRLKRQLRAILFTRKSLVRSGLDMVVVIHPRSACPKAQLLEQELVGLCKRTGASP